MQCTYIFEGLKNGNNKSCLSTGSYWNKT